ncbi:MAG TPA: hypothetical protein VII01_08210 [Solirubrobacteraceae bacterium]
MNLLRRLPLYRLLLLVAVVVVAGISVTALAFALSSGPTPPAKPLATAVHDALKGPPVEGVSANITFTNHLLEGANLASGTGQGGGLASSPLISGASGRLWIAKDGRARLELQTEKGDTQLIYDGHTISMYDAASNTVYRYTPPASASKPDAATGKADEGTGKVGHAIPNVAKIEEAIKHLDKHATLSAATPTNVAGQPAYTVHVAPNESGSLLAGAELSFDANNGVPLRAAIYSTTSSSPVIELAASEISFGPVADSVFSFSPPSGAKIEEVKAPSTAKASGHHASSSSAAGKPKLTAHGKGLSTIGVLESNSSSSKPAASGQTEGLPKVKINGISATELRTELGTLLMFERSGVRYVVAGSVSTSAIEAFARGL